ncbi:MAG TPA: nitrile hydratase subunit alpha [Alphaproteobacteria bacterium]|nr:nitrile hydratase subunit alpha [Alphaproteobacteria bacterium]
MDEPATHVHDHHDHTHGPDDHAPIHAHGPKPEYALLERAIRELLIAKGVFGAGDLRRQIDLMDSRSPSQGAKLVARAWVDPEYKKRLLTDAKKAAAELAVDCSNAPEVVVLENTPKRHHLVVCTLCSCYPKAILGIPPAWYKSVEYRARAVKDPRGVLAEFGTKLPEDVEVRVVDSTADMRYLVLPMRPSGSEGWSEERLAALVTRDSMIGVTTPTLPA